MNSLFDSFTVSERSGDGRPWLSDTIALTSDGFGYDPTVMFVSPYHEIDTVVEHPFGDRLLRAMFHAGLKMYVRGE